MSGRIPPFAHRHIGPRTEQVDSMLSYVGYESLDDLSAAVVPASIRMLEDLDLPPALDESSVLTALRGLARRNTVLHSLIGQGYYGCVLPPVIQRNVLESPAWYTAYTPYQPEISQGRLEALLNFQTLVEDLTGLPIAGSSLLDEPTAAAEAMTVLLRTHKGDSRTFLVDSDTHPQTLAVLRTRALPVDIQLIEFDADAALPDVDAFGVLLSYPGSSGCIRDLSSLVATAHERGVGVAVTTDLLALTMLTPPGEWGADVVVGSAQRFGVPFGFGGPHAGFMSVRSGLERSMPGRLVGVSVDADGKPAMRLALQTREQHIRREKATSNICTAQVLLAVVASSYAVYHGPVGLREIAERINDQASRFAAAARAMGAEVVHLYFFDTVVIRCAKSVDALMRAAHERDVNIRKLDAHHVSISCDEVTQDAHLQLVLDAMAACEMGDRVHLPDSAESSIPADLERTSLYLTHPVFSAHQSETAMLRYLRKLSDRDIALDRAMIPLGSCTMKLNATTEMAAVTWPEFADMHPFAPLDQAQGYLELIADLEGWLAEVTGYDAVSVQPNAGSQGEFAGLLAIAAYHKSRGDKHRVVCLIPSSAHGTNAASAVMVGMQVVVVSCDAMGNVDVDDLKAKIHEHADRLAALMITYPSTHGVFETAVTDICAMVHDAGGQVYVDGANLNALVGLAQPGKFGADVSHLNLHKTFCIPHGGGGPGVGPVGVRAHLAPFLPSHPVHPECGPVGRGYADGGIGPVSGAPWGSAGVLQIPWAYVRLMGAHGLKRATQVAILNANYIARRLGDYFPVLYTGENGLVAHECILDLRGITKRSGVSVDDVAKRLVDYGFHAPTMSFPVAGTLMVEPTESEDLQEIERFCEAMIAIRAEIDRVEAGEWPVDDNPLSNAPHTAEHCLGEWAHPYSREIAAYPLPGVRQGKYWPPVRRIDGAFGDRNLVCSCPSPEALAIV
ncbi:MAG: aminomethyl-transferring glycine dehydrogenase [Actinobacteria bacterium]|nr:aminomethyl-transferring glycine dehydrogenase [Actinomycetota bacterium]